MGSWLNIKLVISKCASGLRECDPRDVRVNSIRLRHELTSSIEFRRDTYIKRCERLGNITSSESDNFCKRNVLSHNAKRHDWWGNITRNKRVPLRAIRLFPYVTNANIFSRKISRILFRILKPKNFVRTFTYIRLGRRGGLGITLLIYKCLNVFFLHRNL